MLFQNNPYMVPQGYLVMRQGPPFNPWDSGGNAVQQQQQLPKKQPMSPTDFETAPGSPTTLGTEYTQGYLKTQIGKRMKVMFLIGTNLVQDREGTLVDVGISYIILKETDTNNLVLCDMYSIKFVTIYNR